MLMVPGSNGEAGAFEMVAEHLAARYTVVIYDRRGFSRSQLDGPQDYEHRLSTDADDVQRLIAHLTGQPPTVFGNSSGALLALEVLTRYSKQVQMVVAHEPSAVTLLPHA